MQLPSTDALRSVPRPSRRAIRAVSLVVVLAGVVLLGNSALGGQADPAAGEAAGNSSVPYGYHVDLEEKINSSDPPTRDVPPGAEVTVIANQGYFPDDENAELVAITRNGTVVYHNNTYGVYFDVDPVPGTRFTVEYVASAQLGGCQQYSANDCTRNVIERVNLSTGEVERLHSAVTPKITATRWHDVDRINDTHVALADIHRDSVRILNLSSGETTWEWSATNIYDHEGSDPPRDWTHLNDVEVLDDGTLMLSMRNQDEVVFVKPGEGYLPGMTLGTDGDHGVLYHQHNPDYIPEERGGPAIVVGDSENNRVVEYRRVDGEWRQAWLWRDARMQWPRDADRLPNNRTLITDSNGDRVLEVSPNGSIAWSAHVGMPYDVERLGTGDESTGGWAISEEHRGRVVVSGPVGEVLLFLKDVLPSKVVNGALFSASAVGAEWFGFADLVVTVLVALALLVWALLEYRWATWTVTGAARDAWHRARDLG
jgi:hypothetical protein